MKAPNDARRARDALRTAWRTVGWYPDATVGEAIAAGAAAHSDAAVVFAPSDGEPSTVTLAALHAEATRLAARLQGAGVEAGDAVVVQAPADAVSTEALVALWTLGAVVVPLTVTAGPDEVAHVVAETGASTIVVTPRWRGADVASAVAARRAPLGLDRVLVLGPSAPDGAAAVDRLPAATLARTPRPEPWSVACVLYTSGSTAAPKGVQHTHETLLFGLDLVPADTTTRPSPPFPPGTSPR